MNIRNLIPLLLLIVIGTVGKTGNSPGLKIRKVAPIYFIHKILIVVHGVKFRFLPIGNCMDMVTQFM